MGGLNVTQSRNSSKSQQGRELRVSKKRRSLVEASPGPPTQALFLLGARPWLPQTKRNLWVEGQESHTWWRGEEGGEYERVSVKESWPRWVWGVFFSSVRPFRHVFHPPLLQASPMFEAFFFFPKTDHLLTSRIPKDDDKKKLFMSFHINPWVAELFHTVGVIHQAM